MKNFFLLISILVGVMMTWCDIQTLNTNNNDGFTLEEEIVWVPQWWTGDTEFNTGVEFMTGNEQLANDIFNPYFTWGKICTSLNQENICDTNTNIISSDTKEIFASMDLYDAPKWETVVFDWQYLEKWGMNIQNNKITITSIDMQLSSSIKIYEWSLPQGKYQLRTWIIGESMTPYVLHFQVK